MIRGKIDIMLEKLWFAEKNQGRVVDVDKMDEINNISLKAFNVPGETSERRCWR